MTIQTLKRPRMVILVLMVSLGAVLTWVAVVVFGSGTVPISQPGWSYDPLQVALKPIGGRWLGFYVGQPRLEALDNACRLVAAREVGSGNFVCPSERTMTAGLDMSFADGPAREYWELEPHLLPWRRHCVGLSAEQLSVYLEAGRVQEIAVDCGHIELP